MDTATLIRLVRFLGVAVLLTAVPSGLIAWSDQGIGTAVLLFGTHVYVGAFCLFVLPWLLRRQAE